MFLSLGLCSVQAFVLFINHCSYLAKCFCDSEITTLLSMVCMTTLPHNQNYSVSHSVSMWFRLELITAWVLPAAACLFLHLLLRLSLSSSSFLPHSVHLSADVIVYLCVHSMARGLWGCQQSPLPHPICLSTPQSHSKSHLITASLATMLALLYTENRATASSSQQSAYTQVPYMAKNLTAHCPLQDNYYDY